jgi:hypothetical protein
MRNVAWCLSPQKFTWRGTEGKFQVHTDKLGLVADTILASGADLVALQEVADPEAISMLVAVLNLKAACSEQPLPARKHSATSKEGARRKEGAAACCTSAIASAGHAC